MIRGHISRKKFKNADTDKVRILLNKIILKGRRKYFTHEEFWETISKTKKYKFMSGTPEYKDIIYNCSGARYLGNVVGGFRHGNGRMKW